MNILIAALAAVAVFGLINGFTADPDRRRRDVRAPRRADDRLGLRLRQAGVSLSPARYRATIAGSVAGVFVVGYGLTGTWSLAVVPAVAVGFAPRGFYRRRQRKALAARMAAWPEAIRDVLSRISVGSTLHAALVELGRTGPEPLRLVWRRYARDAGLLEVPAALAQAQAELADPVSDRVIEAFAAAHERGHTVIVEVLGRLAEDVTKDLQLTEQIITSQTEVRAQAVVAVLLPFVVLVLLVSTNDGFRNFYQSATGAAVIAVGAGMGVLGWKLINAIGRLPEEPRVLTAPEGTAMTGQVLAIAALAALAAFCLARAAVRTPMSLTVRLAPYTDRVRARLGTTTGAEPPTASTTVWGPMITATADRLGNLVDAGTTEQLTLRLSQAGLATITAADYRRRQLGYTAAGLIVGVAAALLVGLSATAMLLVAAAFAAAGALRWRAKVDGLIDDRRTRMRAEAHTVCQMLAVWLRTGDTPSGALDRLAVRASGVVPGELAEAAAQIRSGSPPVEVLERLATRTAEPSAARLYRLYGASWTAGGDPAGLLALSDSLRATRRDALARTMARRRVAMALPLVAVIAPILILFIAATLPTIVFG